MEQTGGILITPLPGALTLKPSSASRPFFGIEPIILREDDTEADIDEGGYLAIKKPWPGLMRTVYGNHKRYIETYWSRFLGIYLAGDGARKDKDGDYWLMGRIDGVINISGHRIGTTEVESALVSHQKVAESAVIKEEAITIINQKQEEKPKIENLITLLITGTLIQKSRETGDYEKIDNMMKIVDSMKGSINIISSEHEGGKKLNGLGGIAAILRYKLNY